MQKNRKDLIKSMCFNAIFASLYVVLVFAFGDFSFGFTNGLISLRIAEAMIPLCCFNKKFIPGAIIGCLCANLIGGNPIDIIVGTIQTILSVMVLHFVKPKQLSLFLAALICGVIIGLDLYCIGASSIGLWVIFTTFIGEYIILELGYLVEKKYYSSVKIK